MDLARSGGHFKRVFGKWGVFRIYDDSITGSGKLHELTKLDHSRILENQKLLGFELSLLENLNLKIKLFSIFRRIRNILFHILLTFILK